ncbi:hypothetical protein DMENIID0001_050830 [Sergentomyia squamirostris]
MMMTKIRNRCFPESDPSQDDQVHQYDFNLGQWQRSKQVKIIYLLYRWLAAIFFLAVLSCSMLDMVVQMLNTMKITTLNGGYISRTGVYWRVLFRRAKTWLTNLDVQL